jgi:hypothetical protein
MDEPVCLFVCHVAAAEIDRSCLTVTRGCLSAVRDAGLCGTADRVGDCESSITSGAGLGRVRPGGTDLRIVNLETSICKRRLLAG